jgi:putative transposase
LSLAKACKFIGLSRQAYYQQIRAEAALHKRDDKVVELVREVRRRQPRVGGRKLHYLLHARLLAAGIKLGRDALFATLKRAHLLVARARAYHKTTDSFHRFYKHPNLLKSATAIKAAKHPEQLWVADITYVPTQQQCVYLSLVTDAFSRKNRRLPRPRHVADRGSRASTEDGVALTPKPPTVDSSFRQ